MLPAILSFAGPALTPAERAFFRAADPAGFILFGRNVRDKAQLRALTDSLRELSGRGDLPILIDQEGGRVARLGPPVWPAFPAPARFAALYAKAPISAIEAARVNALAIAVTLAEVGINVDCLPLLDVAQPGAHASIGDRALGAEPMQVAALGRAMLDGLAAGGVAGVVKHMPGQGRACADSHAELPVVDAAADDLAADLAPFRTLAGAAMAMTAHVLYPAWDAARPASVSPKVISEVIRGAIGYDGLLMSDDIGMAALTGSVAARARDVVAAGCDVALHCSGVLEESAAVAGALGEMTEPGLARLKRATAGMGTVMGTVASNCPRAMGYAALAAKRDALLAYA